jgi:molecular chaperone HscC
VKQFGSQMMDGFFQPVIHRNTTIPVSREEVFGTVEQNQYKVQLRVFQGESRKVKDNLLLGELSIEGIPPGPKGTEFAVRFTYDLNGILEVEAYIPASGKKFRTVLAQGAAGLSAEEIERAVRKMQAIKFYPRDDTENQRLLLFCERLVGEIDPFRRDELEQSIDRFEQAMSSGDREFFCAAREGLLLFLSQIGFVYDGDEERKE